MLIANHWTECGVPMKELEKGLKELRGFAAPWGEQQCQQARPPGAPNNCKVAVASETHSYQERQLPMPEASLGQTAFPKAQHKCFWEVQKR